MVRPTDTSYFNQDHVSHRYTPCLFAIMFAVAVSCFSSCSCRNGVFVGDGQFVDLTVISPFCFLVDVYAFS